MIRPEDLVIPENVTDFQDFWMKLPTRDKLDALKLVSSYSVFRQVYRNNLEGFVLDCFKWNKKKHIYPSLDQLKALRKFQESKRLSIRALHGVGKTGLAAFVVLWFALTRDVDSDWKVITTASSWRQLEKYLWPEIHKWVKLLKWELIGRPPIRKGYDLLKLNIKLNTGAGFAVASDNHEYIEGAHADSILYVFDESKAIPEETWDAAEGAFSTAGADMDSSREAFLLSISTPGEPRGRFFDIQSKKAGFLDWTTMHMTLEHAIEQQRVSKEWVENRRKQWGETSALYQNRVKGEFAQSSEDSVCPLALIEAAVNRWKKIPREELKIVQIGFDPARFGGDRSVAAFRHGNTITSLNRWSKKDTMFSTGKLVSFNNINKNIRFLIDVIGLGAGIYDRAKEKGLKVTAYNAASATKKRDRSKEFGFVNKRSAGWWMMRELLEDGEIALPDDELLIGDLAAPKWTVTSGGKIKVDSKDDMKKLLGRSTDDADAVIMAFWQERMPGISV